MSGWMFYSDRVETNVAAEPFATAEAAQDAAVADYLARNPLPECAAPPHECLHWRPERIDEPRRFWLELHARFIGHTVFAVEDPAEGAEQADAETGRAK